MPASWSFNRADPSDVEIEITQRDQFNNDDVGLNDALVREVIQNSLDAHKGDKPVRVCFDIQELSSLGEHVVEMLQENIRPLEPDFKACKIPLPDHSNVRVLTIEDFNTEGLTGSVDKKNHRQNFTNFWRVVGKSRKKGQHGGRWGLGKLVFSSSSQVRVFFGITRRSGDVTPVAMGQVLLEHHKAEGEHRRPHGFWHDGRAKDNIQRPTVDDKDLEFLETISNTRRRVKTGLSIIIPYIHDSINEQDLVKSVLRNYYFPIISGHLEVEVGFEGKLLKINSATFGQIFKKTDLNPKIIPVSFLTEVSRRLADQDNALISLPMQTQGFSKLNFDDSEIEELKAKFKDGKLIHVKVPITLKRKDQQYEHGNFHLFLQSDKNEPPFDFFARGPILLTAEKSKIAGQVRSGIVAEYGDIVSEFLGDAETPSHTKLNYRATKLLERWDKSASQFIVGIRNSLKVLFDIVAEQEDTTDSDALSQFFSIKELQKSKKGKKRKPGGEDGKDGGTEEQTPPKPVGFVIAKNVNGFTLVSTADSENWPLPRKIRVTMAYDMVTGNPLRYYNPYDFDLYDPETMTVTCVGGQHEVIESNVLRFEVNQVNFQLSVTLSDLNRDLFVQAEIEK